MAYDNTNRISIWRNQERREGKEDAHFTGSVNVDGVEYWVNLWKRKETAKPTAPALSGTIKPKQQKTASGSPHQRQSHGDDFNDDIPW